MAYVANPVQGPARRPSPRAVRRDRAVKSARRHSRLVRLLKTLLPLSAFGVSSLYLAPMALKYLAPPGKIAADAVDVTTGSLKMVHPSYSGVHPTYGSYTIRAESSTQNIKSTDVFLLDQIKAHVVSPSKETTTLTAPDGVLASKEELLHLNNGALIVGSNGLWANLRKADVTFKDRVVTSHDPVEIRLHDSVITSDSAVIYASESRVVFTGSVHVHMVREPEAAKAAPTQDLTTSQQTEPASPAPQAGADEQVQSGWEAGQTAAPEGAHPANAFAASQVGKSSPIEKSAD